MGNQAKSFLLPGYASIMLDAFKLRPIMLKIICWHNIGLAMGLASFS